MVSEKDFIEVPGNSGYKRRNRRKRICYASPKGMQAERRGFQGQIASGSIAVGDEIAVLPGGEKANVQSILYLDCPVERAEKGQPVSIRLNREIDVSRGCVLARDADLKVSSMFTASILWMDDTKLVQGKNYLIKLGTRILPAVVMSIK